MNEELKEAATTIGKATEEKHIELSNAIEEMDRLNYHANELIDHITGAASDPVNEPPSLRPSLSDVLESGAMHIREKTKQVSEKLSRISELLF